MPRPLPPVPDPTSGVNGSHMNTKSQNTPSRFFATRQPRNWRSDSVSLGNARIVFAADSQPPQKLRYPKILKPKINLRRTLWVSPPSSPNPLQRVTHLPGQGGHLVSLFFRRVFENRNLKNAVGANLALMTLLSGIVRAHTSLTALAFIPVANAEVQINNEPKVDLVTKESIIRPLTEYNITQEFSLFHPAIDLATAIGSPVRPIMNGVVVESDWSWFGYGNTVVVNHKNGYVSRYAHLSKIFVREGEEITTDTVLGLSGSTGHSTGPHLHLEITNHGIPINPRTLLE